MHRWNLIVDPDLSAKDYFFDLTTTDVEPALQVFVEAFFMVFLVLNFHKLNLTKIGLKIKGVKASPDPTKLDAHLGVMLAWFFRAKIGCIDGHHIVVVFG
jgi:hypothetical protein